MTDFPGKGKVAVLKTSPETVLEDIDRLTKLAGVEQALPHRLRQLAERLGAGPTDELPALGAQFVGAVLDRLADVDPLGVDAPAHAVLVGQAFRQQRLPRGGEHAVVGAA